MFKWQLIITLFCYLIEVDPFNEPDVNESKILSLRVLNGTKKIPERSKETAQNSIPKLLNKSKENSPNIVDSLIKGEIDLVINTTKSTASIKDSYQIRRTSLVNNIPYFTTIAGAKVAVDAIKTLKKNNHGNR